MGHCVTSRSLVLSLVLSSLAICDVSEWSQPRSRQIYLSPWSASQHHRGVGSVGCKGCWKRSASVSHAVLLQDINTCAGPERRSLSWSMRWRHARYSYSYLFQSGDLEERPAWSEPVHKNTHVPLQELSCKLTHYMVFRWIRWIRWRARRWILRTPIFVQRAVDRSANYNPTQEREKSVKSKIIEKTLPSNDFCTVAWIPSFSRTWRKGRHRHKSRCLWNVSLPFAVPQPQNISMSLLDIMKQLNYDPGIMIYTSGWLEMLISRSRCDI